MTRTPQVNALPGMTPLGIRPCVQGFSVGDKVKLNSATLNGHRGEILTLTPTSAHVRWGANVASWVRLDHLEKVT